jgi:hypothetical protein
MKSVSIKKSTLLEKIKANREGHEKIYKEALAGYLVAARQKLKSLLAKIEEGKVLNAYVGLTPPSVHLKEYDRAIEMLELSEDEVVELDARTFAQLVQDDWDWKHSFLSTNSSYSGAAAAALHSEEEGL